MQRGHKRRVDPAILVRAFVRRKNDIMRPNMTLLPLSSPGWTLLAADLGNRLAVGTLRNMTKRPDIAEALLTDSPIPSASPPRDRRYKPLNLLRIQLLKNNLANRMARRRADPSKIELEIGTCAIPTRKAQLVLPEGYPTMREVSKENAAPSSTTNDAEDDKSEIQLIDIRQQPQVRLQRMPTDTRKIVNSSMKLTRRGRQPKVERSILINEILKRSSEIVQANGKYATLSHPVWTRIANAVGNVILPVTIRNIARQKEICDMIIGRKSASVAVPRGVRVSENRPAIGDAAPRRCNIQCDVMMNALVKHRDEILLADGRYVPPNNPIWSRIANDLGNEISGLAVYKIAHRPEIRERMVVKDKKNATLGADNDASRKRRKIDSQIVIDAILSRRAEIIDAEGRYVSNTHLVWSRIANDLNNLITPITVYNVASRHEVREVVLLKRDKQDENSSSVAVEEQTDGSTAVGDIRDEINHMVFEDAIPELLKTIDATNALAKEMKELRRIVREEIQGLKNEIREEIQEFKNETREEIQEFKKETRDEIQELKREVRDEIKGLRKDIREEFKELRKDMRGRDKYLNAEHQAIHLN